jgi:hypothetical protein
MLRLANWVKGWRSDFREQVNRLARLAARRLRTVATRLVRAAAPIIAQTRLTGFFDPEPAMIYLS